MKLASITKREIEILKLAALGFSREETAAKLFLSMHTVDFHRYNIMQKTGTTQILGALAKLGYWTFSLGDENECKNNRLSS